MNDQIISIKKTDETMRYNSFSHKTQLALSYYGVALPIYTKSDRFIICNIDGLVQDCSNSSALAME